MRYIFADCVLDTECYELQRAGISTALRPRTYQVLIYLIENRGRAVPAEELLEQLWPSRRAKDVYQANVAACIKEIRHALGDDGHTQQFIKTRHKQGYQFIPTPQTDTAIRPAQDTPLTQPTPPSSAVDLSAYRTVTVMRCGLVVDRLAETLESETWHRLRLSFFQILQENLLLYGGTTHRHFDTGAQVLFGVPTAQEDHAQRAVTAAAAVFREWHAHPLPKALHRGLPVPLQIALHSGRVMLSTIEHQNPLITGLDDTFALAEELRVQAEPNNIILSTAVAQLVEKKTHLEALVTRLGPAYRLKESHEQSPFPAQQTQLSTFVGREWELGQLQRLWRQVQQGRGQVIGIVGEPGIGKSRLVYEFRQSLAKPSVTYWSSRCVSYGQATPYLPLVGLLRHSFGIKATGDQATVADKVQQELQKRGLDAASQGPYLRYLMGESTLEAELLATHTPHSLKVRTFDSLHQWWLADARQQPLVLEIEDLHWLDNTTEDYLNAWVPQLIAVPILLLVTGVIQSDAGLIIRHTLLIDTFQGDADVDPRARSRIRRAAESASAVACPRGKFVSGGRGCGGRL